MLDFLTSKTGLFAAILAVFGLGAALWKLYTEVVDRRAKAAEKEAAAKRSGQGLAIVDQQLSELSLSSNSYELQFLLTNTGSRRLIMRTLRLHVTARSETQGTRASFTLAPLKIHKRQVRFVANEDVYDIRKRQFGPGAEPLAFEPGEAEAFVVKLVSDETKRYGFHVEAEWYGAMDPDKTGTARSATLDAEFPERVSAGSPKARPS